VLVLDRYEIGERQTSACAAPTVWLERLGLADTICQTFGRLVLHTPWRTLVWELPWTFSTFDYPALCAKLWQGCGAARFETAAVTGRSHGEHGAVVVRTDRGDLRSRLVVDALGWRRVLSSAADPIQPPAAMLSRGLEVHPHGRSEDLELWLDERYVRRGYSWRFPAGDEQRVGVGSFDPRAHVREPTVRLAHDLELPADGFQGNWIPHQMRAPVEGDVFFAGDSAGHCLPATAEGIRPALYFGAACGRELALVLEGRQTRAQALLRYAAACEARRHAYTKLLRAQRFVGRTNPSPVLTGVLTAFGRPRFLEYAFNRYAAICPPPAAA
jgi:flavin-dependent dehydrogenase